MAEQHVDPSGNTQAFRAFVDSEEDVPTSSLKLPLIVGGAFAAVVALALLLWLLLD